MILCKNCSYWIDDSKELKYEDDQIMHPYDFDTYKEMEMPFKVKKCKCPNITLFERNPNSNGVSLCDGSDYKATMYTGPNFGCINGKL